MSMFKTAWPAVSSDAEYILETLLVRSPMMVGDLSMEEKLLCISVQRRNHTHATSIQRVLAVWESSAPDGREGWTDSRKRTKPQIYDEYALVTVTHNIAAVRVDSRISYSDNL